MADILERLREWHQARVGTYPLLEPAIEEITRLRAELASVRAEMDINWQPQLDEIAARIAKLEQAQLLGTPIDGKAN